MNKEQLEREIQHTEEHLRYLLEQYQQLQDEPEYIDLEALDPREFIYTIHAQAFDDSRRRR